MVKGIRLLVVRCGTCQCLTGIDYGFTIIFSGIRLAVHAGQIRVQPVQLFFASMDGKADRPFKVIRHGILLSAPLCPVRRQAVRQQQGRRITAVFIISHTVVQQTVGSKGLVLPQPCLGKQNTATGLLTIVQSGIRIQRFQYHLGRIGTVFQQYFSPVKDFVLIRRIATCAQRNRKNGRKQ